MAGTAPRFDSERERRGRGEVRRIEADGHTFTIEYGEHNQEQPPLPLDEDALVLEGVGDRRSQNISEAGLQHIQYRALVEEAQRLGKPIFLPDLAFDPNLEARSAAEIHELEQILGISLLLPAIASGAAAAKAGTENPTRRTILAAGAGIFALSAVYVWGKAALESQKSRRSNPAREEQTVLELKNDVIAQKLHTIAGIVGTSRLVIGKRHGGIEDSLRATSSQRATGAMRALHQIEGSAGEEVALQIRTQLSYITRLDYVEKENKWKLSIVEDPILATLSRR